MLPHFNHSVVKMQLHALPLATTQQPWCTLCACLPTHLLHVDVALGAGLEELDAKLICKRLAAAEGHRPLVLIHIALVAHQNLQGQEPQLRLWLWARVCQWVRTSKSCPPVSSQVRLLSLTLLTVDDACVSMFFIQLRTLLKDASSVTSYTSRMPMAPR